MRRFLIWGVRFAMRTGFGLGILPEVFPIQIKGLTVRTVRRLIPLDQEYTLDAHQDSGAMERWEDPQYQECYRKIFEGKWEEYDPWNADYRSDAKTDLYETGSKLK